MILVALLRHKQIQTLERLFRLANLLAPSEDLPRIYFGLQSSDRETLASGRELVEHLVPAEHREAILAVVDDLYDPAPLENDDDWRIDYDATMRSLLDSGNEMLSALAAYHCGEARLARVRDALVEVRDRHSERHAEVVEQALARLEAGR